jgi:hypothetical protein
MIFVVWDTAAYKIIAILKARPATRLLAMVTISAVYLDVFITNFFGQHGTYFVT